MRKKVKEIRFDEKGDFMAYYAAEKWAKENGYSYGSMCSPQPTALFKGDCDVAKWKNLSNKERSAADGLITSELGGFREGPIIITIFE